MFNDTADVIKTAAVFLAIVLPILATAAAYWSANRKPQPKPTIGGEGMAAIGGALVTQDMLAKAMDTAHEVKESINRLARALEILSEEENLRTHLRTMVDEIAKLRRTAEDIAKPGNGIRGRR